MLSVPEQVESNILQRRLFRQGQPILLAISGGVDSMVLLRLIYELSGKFGWKLTVAHLNHQLRGSSSLADERLVRRTTKALKLPVVVSRAHVRAFAKERGLSLEMAARNLRHDFLAGVALERNISTIALAHHLDDQVELFLLRLLRGSGSQGLAGMKWCNPSPNHPAVTLVRPLLNCPKSAVRQFALAHKISFREDTTNLSRRIQRNRIRHDLLPMLERYYQPGISKGILRVMDILAAESDLVNSVAESWLQRNGWGRVKLDDEPRQTQNSAASILRRDFESIPFAELPLALQRRCVHLELIRHGVVPDFDLVEHLRLYPDRPIEVRRGDPTTRPNPPVHDAAALVPVRLVRTPQGRVQKHPTPAQPLPHQPGKLVLQPARGQLEWEGVRFTWRLLPIKGCARPPRPKPGDSEFFDADAVGAEVILRHWRPGDRFQPIGMTKGVKLQDLFVNQKVPQNRRHQLVVASTIHGELFWVEGLRVSERFKLTKSTIRRLHWAWQRL